MEALGIGQLAKRGGVGIDTVRYYERNGLLTPHTRLASGYRRYSELELSRLRFIRRAQALGFTLKEIKELLALSAQRDVGRGGVARVACVPERCAHSSLMRNHRLPPVIEAPLIGALSERYGETASRDWTAGRFLDVGIVT